jgi:hypothetical protein
MALTPSGGVYGDAGTSAGSAVPSGTQGGNLSTLGITGAGLPFCVTDTVIGSPHYQICLGANTLGGGLISYNAYAGAPTLPLQLDVNGALYQFPGNGQGNILGPVTTTINEPMVWANTIGTLAKDGLNAPIAHTGTFSASGATTFGSTVGITGNTTVGGTLGVTGLETLSGGLNLTGVTTINSGLTAAQIFAGGMNLSVPNGLDGYFAVPVSGTGAIAFGNLGAWAYGIDLSGATYTNTALRFGGSQAGSSILSTTGYVQLGTTTPVHLAFAQTTPPALTSCGTSPSDTGATDGAGMVTMGTGTPTGCVITFNAAYTSAPNCTVTWRATPLASQSYAVSTTAITLTQTATSSNVVDYRCSAPAGG